MAKFSQLVMITSIAVFAAAGCKEDNNVSSDKTLTDFAAGKTASGLNSCGDVKRNSFGSQLSIIADPQMADGDKVVATYRDKVEEYFEALPPYYASTFVGKLGGFVMLTDDQHFDALCVKNKDLTPERKKDISACYGYQSGANGTSQLAIIHRISSSESKAKNDEYIRHGGVRAMGMVFSQFMARHDIESNADKLKEGINLRFEAADVDPEVAKLKKELGSRFIVDVVKSGGKYKVETFAPILGNNLSSLTYKANQYSSSNAPADLLAEAGIGAAAAQQFYDYVFAEAFDSAYCTKATAEAAKKDFPRAFGDYDKESGTLKRLEAAVQKHSDRVIAYADANTQASESNGLSLTDGYSLQNGSAACNCCNGTCCAGGCCGGTCSPGSCTCTAAPITQVAKTVDPAAAAQMQTLLFGILAKFLG